MIVPVGSDQVTVHTFKSRKGLFGASAGIRQPRYYLNVTSVLMQYKTAREAREAVIEKYTEQFGQEG